ncbi:MAG: acyltransferase [Bacteroidia bacterium]
MSKSGSSDKLYFSNLDATRFLGFFHVFLAHCFFTSNSSIANSAAFEIATMNIRAGFLGLDYFFVLSAFLLTRLALEERKKTGGFHPGLFLVRRGLRLWPLYFFLVLSTYAISAFRPELFSKLPPIEIFLLFYSNIWISLHGQDFLFFLVFFWSIAAEEQFYLLWAFVLKFLQRHLKLVLFLMVLVSLAFRYLSLDYEPGLFFNTLSYLGNFAFGGWAALVSFENGLLIARFRTISKLMIGSVYLVLLILLVFYFRWFMSPAMVVFEKIVFSSFFVFLILEQTYSENSLIKLGSLKAISYLGRLSLGLYCYHGIVITFYHKMAMDFGLAESGIQVFLINPLIILALTIVISILSFELVEKRIHALRRYAYPKTSSSTSGV